MSKLDNPKKVENAWAMYDWANSVYSLVISTAIFPIFYGAMISDRVEVFGYEVDKIPLISYVTAICFVFVSILSPILSGIADYANNKKFFMKVFCYIGATSCMGLAYFNEEYIELSLLMYMLACIGFWNSLVFYNAFLPEIAPPEDHDRISAKGFSYGYIGSVILLVICLMMVMKYDWFGLENELSAMKWSFFITGIWWIGFAQITYLGVPEEKSNNKITNQILWSGFKELKKVWNQLKKIVRLKRYLGSFFLYSMAVQTVMLAAVFFAEHELPWESNSQKSIGLIVCTLLIQLVAILGAYLLSFVSKKIGNIKALGVTIVIWIMVCVYAFFVQTPSQFYIAAAFVGLVMGGIQSLSRSTYSKLLPETHDTASFFSFYDVAEKVGIVIGMFLYGFVGAITGSMRYAVLFLVLFFILGLIQLFRIPKDETGIVI